MSNTTPLIKLAGVVSDETAAKLMRLHDKLRQVCIAVNCLQPECDICAVLAEIEEHEKAL